ncbi:unnamed protein product [Mucor hiemalis]
MTKSLPYTVTRESLKTATSYNCPFGCEKQYKYKRGLNEHIKKVHHNAIGESSRANEPTTSAVVSEDESEAESEPEAFHYDSDESEEEEEEEEGGEDIDDDMRGDIDTVMDDFQNTFNTTNSNVWEENIGEGNPFKNPQTMIMMCLFNGFANSLSRSQLKTLLYAIGKITDLAIEATKEGKPFSMPSANMIMKSHENKGYDGPSLSTTTTEHTVVIRGQERISKCSANLPSEHLKLSMANPRQCKYMSCLPDRSPGISRGLSSGKKWTTHPLFQPPQFSLNGKDIWVGDVVTLYGQEHLFLLKSFFRRNNDSVADGYIVFKDNETFGIVSELCIFSLKSVRAVVDKSTFSLNNCCSLTLGSEVNQSLLPEHNDLLFKENVSKVEKNGKPGEYLKVVISPIIFFTDDTSGGTSKQHIPYESWSMTYAALSLEDRGRRENTMFIGCAPKSDGINAMHFIPELSRDMKALEAGVIMYSSEFDEEVIVRAP